MAEFFKAKGLSEAGVNKVIAVAPDDTNISYMTASILLTNNTGEDGFVKIAICEGDSSDPEQEDWIDAGHPLFAVTAESTGLRFTDDLGNLTTEEPELDDDGNFTRDSVVITDHGSSERSPVLIGPSERVVVWSNISGISVRVSALTQSKCGARL